MHFIFSYSKYSILIRIIFNVLKKKNISESYQYKWGQNTNISGSSKIFYYSCNSVLLQLNVRIYVNNSQYLKEKSGNILRGNSSLQTSIAGPSVALR